LFHGSPIVISYNDNAPFSLVFQISAATASSGSPTAAAAATSSKLAGAGSDGYVVGTASWPQTKYTIVYG